ncbi:putative SNF2 family helicase/ATPase [Aspergillus homomorphus CBS 101889]|uniref:Putative SNF2 family helicase/ATPase n=1 Tax=Aspergillus homomorphus (strain CBS 101889) TaxID=1450537 RepID=A0A395HM32_ASPHC|nr:putative SNF2 family helicase/ATPase [Aspergillus homomorphus CBS 101889]RAL08676.1 putative SNF2 family helicase/ATPase [Aspergillus homomorphus CBS 101889]
MAAVTAEVNYSGCSVPESLGRAFLVNNGTENVEHPIKRRKLASAPQSLRAINGLSASRVPRGYITLSRVHLQLNFAPLDTTGDLTHSAEVISDLPVVIHAIRCPPVQSATSANGGNIDNRIQLKLLAISGQTVLFTDQITNAEVIDAIGADLILASNLICADRFIKIAPSVCYQATLHRYPNGSSFGLEVTILWKDSADIPDIRRLSPDAIRVFSKYVLKESDYRFAENGTYDQKKVRLGQGPSWSPRDFYDNVYVPPNSPTDPEMDFAIPGTQLFPFQRRAVRWLLQREGAVEMKAENDLPASFFQITDADGAVCYASHLFMIVISDFSGWNDAYKTLKGGLLAEEMGLGKTVEMISLICLHRRDLLSESKSSSRTGDLTPSGATLIITPPAILEQWKEELLLHAPALRVFHYEGINRHQEVPEKSLIEMLAGHDVVLTTYNVLSREIHYSENAPERNLRHQKRFKPRRSPLVQIHWWRTCLDEGQMIESGISAAAKVARLIPRQMAWVVTGTPIRKDITDLLGILLFLRLEPYCGSFWNRLCLSFRPVLAHIVNTTALRHSKDRIRSELRLPPQKRVVVTIPFTAIEEQNYKQLYEQMCEECGLDLSGAPISDDWNPDDWPVIEKMRSWLVRLRQTCLHPAGNRRRGLTAGFNGPLRRVEDVLEAMIDQNTLLIHAEERSDLFSKLRRGQMLENALQKVQARDLWASCLSKANEIVESSRDRLRTEIERVRALPRGSTNQELEFIDAANHDDNNRISAYRSRLRNALEVQHMTLFFLGNAYYQIKSDPKLTDPESDAFKFLEKQEEEAYAIAKSVRKEMLTDVSGKVGNYMKTIKEMLRNKRFVVIPKMKPHLYSTGIEARRVLENFEDFCEAMNEHAAQYDKWRLTMVHLLSQSLIDQEDESELQGDEYERSTTHQSEMYVYMEALRAMYADRHDCLTGQKNVLIAHEVKGGIIQAQKGEGPSPELYLKIMNVRSRIRPDPQFGSLRGIISELRSLTTSLEWQATEGSTRAQAELEIVSRVLKNASTMAAEHAKVNSSLEREVEMFRDTMNCRLEYYRRLQLISDSVATFDESSVGKPLDEVAFEAKVKEEKDRIGKISALRAKHRYLIHLRDEPDTDESTCVICQSTIEEGVMTHCGHQFCLECLRLWYVAHRTCPSCKLRLKAPSDFHPISYKSREIIVQQERAPTDVGSERSSSQGSIYNDISSSTLNEIKQIDLDCSFGTKIDTIARHVIWLRENDPGAKTIVFTQWSCEMLASAFKRFRIGFSSVDSKGGVQQFKSDPALECLLLHARAHASGLNLVCATHVIFCEPLINTAIELQAIARVHRIGQQRPTTVWMYLVADTVEQSIYDLSVSRRLAHIAQKTRAQEFNLPQASKCGAHETANGNLTETAIDAANSLEIEDAPLTKMMASGVSGGELVQKDDLWLCLFGGSNRNKRAKDGTIMNAEGEVARFLRGEAAEQRRAAAANA